MTKIEIKLAGIIDEKRLYAFLDEYGLTMYQLWM